MKIFKFSMLVILALSIVQCTNDANNDVQPENSLDQEKIPSEVLAKLESLGFDMEKTSIKSSKGGFIVDGDIFFTDKSVKEENLQKQAFFGIVDCNRAGNIRIQNALGNNAAGRGFRRGLNLWNRVNNTTLQLVEVNSNPDILVRLSTPGEIGGWGLGEFPTNGVEGGLIILNLNEPSIDGDPVTAREWGNILAHEIGHNIGFVHSEQDNLGTRVPGTPLGDPNSIMVSGSNPGIVFNANQVSNNDARAVRRMYSNRNNRLCGR
ncbi:hypothetical protein AWE51_18390 [Aquimarina aggregata]|uniref:Dual-action HEIGH metallo-peptidase n=1 Tax=Aquimarina aggregata TaxID=1642818 RepID=A0A165SBP8_9FLAO|nr:hypothetical protein [Aquimarina aggregata]KZS38015.1 hypothetical protein AWE51_18390 [Aquimarina aggregata]